MLCIYCLPIQYSLLLDCLGRLLFDHARVVAAQADFIVMMSFWEDVGMSWYVSEIVGMSWYVSEIFEARVFVLTLDNANYLQLLHGDYLVPGSIIGACNCPGLASAVSKWPGGCPVCPIVTSQ